ncbi:MAG: Ig-like domain-containing protein [Patescibacteria group bacterium]
MPAKKPSNRKTPAKLKLASSSRYSLKRMLPFLLIFAVVGTVMLWRSFAMNSNQPPQRFVNQPERGLIWAGLRANPNSALCGGHLLEVIGRDGNATGCTHGPDPAPESVDVRRSIQPLSTGEDGLTVASAATVPCDGDGVTGKRVEVIYARASDRPDRYAELLPSLQQWAANMNSAVVESAQATGGNRNIRFVTNPDCTVAVRNVTISTTGDDSIGNTAGEIYDLGYRRTDRKYLMMTDATMYCGIAYFNDDDRAGSNNASNSGPMYARVDSGCWGLSNSVELHELFHTLGAVQYSAPHTSGGGHCTDDYDRLCYNDGYGVVMTYPCASTTFERLLDCNHDDYFHTSPPSGNYLTNHWNTANSAFLIQGTGTVPPPSGDTTAPTVQISAPADGSSIGTRATITASSNDNVGVSKMEIYIDGALKASSTGGSISTNWNSRKASKGSHTITVKAYDDAGNVGQSSVGVIK